MNKALTNKCKGNVMTFRRALEHKEKTIIIIKIEEKKLAELKVNTIELGLQLEQMENNKKSWIKSIFICKTNEYIIDLTAENVEGKGKREG